MALHILSLMQIGEILSTGSLNDLLNEVKYQTEIASRDYNLSIQRSSTIALMVLFKAFKQLPHDTRIQFFTSLLPVLRFFDFDSNCKRFVASGVLQSEEEFELRSRGVRGGRALDITGRAGRKRDSTANELRSNSSPVAVLM
jgi:hypothetical protein